MDGAGQQGRSGGGFAHRTREAALEVTTWASLTMAGPVLPSRGHAISDDSDSIEFLAHCYRELVHTDRLSQECPRAQSQCLLYPVAFREA